MYRLTAISLVFCTSVLPAAGSGRYVAALYDALTSGDVDAAVGLFAEDATYAHTNIETAKGHEQLKFLFKSVFYAGPQKEIPTMLDIQLEASHGSTNGAQAFVVARPAYFGNARDSIFVVNGKIQAMMTTKASPKDPAPPDMNEFPVWHNESQSVDKREAQYEQKAIEDAVNVYFNGFGNSQPKEMGNAFWEKLLFMFDFNSNRFMPSGSETAPYLNSRDQLIAALQGVCSGYINFNHRVEAVHVQGALAVATTVSNGCKGDLHTPEGSKPMPNREMFVLIRNGSKWKIHSYMVTYDPASPIESPVSECPPHAQKQLQCVENQAIGSCPGVGWFCDDASHCEGITCVCDPGHCSYDAKTCVVSPTTTATTMTTVTLTTTVSSTKFCNADAVVGHCVEVGCFMEHGSAHCEGTQCKCDPGSCSYDDWTCVATNGSAVALAQAVVSDEAAPFSKVTKGSSAGTTALVGATFGAIFTLLAFRAFRCFVPQGRAPIAEPLL